MLLKMNVSVSLSRAWPFPDTRGELEQWDDLSEVSKNPWEDHGLCRKKAGMGDDVLVLRHANF